MRIRVITGVLAGGLLLPALSGEFGGVRSEVAAQLSTELPGIPSPGVPTLSRSRAEWAWEGALTWKSDDPAVRRFVESRVAVGRSYRIFRNAELGLRLTLADLAVLVPEAEVDGEGVPSRFDGSVGYGVVLGAKYRVLSLVDPQGHGVEAALVGTWQPRLEPAIRHVRQGDDIRKTSGLIAGRAGEADEPVAPSVEVPQRTALGAVVGIRQPRWLADVAVVRQQVGEVEVPWVRQRDGVGVRAGAMARLTPGLSAGVAWWGGGDPPWDNTPIRSDAGRQEASLGLVLSFAERRGAGTRVMITAPTGSFSESIRLYILGYSAR